MTGDEIRHRREHARVACEQVAERAELPVDRVHAWERGEAVPRKQRHALDWALWSLERDAALAASGVPECAAVDLLDVPDVNDQAAVDALLKHLESCRLCAARAAYVKEHVRPEPITGGVLAHVIGLGSRLSGWQASAYTGAMLLLALAGIGVPVLLGLGLITRDASYLGAALGLFGLLVVSGGVGGIAYHLTRGLRESGAPGHYASSILAVYAYLATVFGLLALAELVLGRPVDPEMSGMLSDPVGWVIFAIVGALFGAVLGRQLR